MKNKKLFAILTLVCFMFTLMPVAAFAEADTTTPWAEETDGSWYVENEDATSFEITTAGQLAYLAKAVNEGNNFSGKTIKLVNNIDLENREWTPIGRDANFTSKDLKAFAGTFDGNGKTISNMKITRTEATYNSDYKYGVGLFANVASGAVVKDLTLSNSTIDCAYFNMAGLVAGYGYGTFENVKVTDCSLTAYGKVGGIVGGVADTCNVVFTNCSVSDSKLFCGAYDCAGIIGLVQGNVTMTGCTVSNLEMTPWSSSDEYAQLDTYVTCADNAAATCLGNGTPVKGTHWISSGYYWASFADFYVKYGAGSHDCELNGTNLKLANSEQMVNAQAEIDGVKYLTLADAIEAVEAGDTIVLLSDINMSKSKAITKPVAIDMNGHDIHMTEQGVRFQVQNGGSIELQGKGTLVEDKPYYGPIVVKGKAPTTTADVSVIIGKDVTLKGWAGLFVDAAGSGSTKDYTDYTMNILIDGTLVGLNDGTYNGYGLYINGSVNYTDNYPTITVGETAVLNSTGYGIYAAGYTDMTVKNGASIIGDTTGVEIRAGKLTVEGGTITGEGVPTSVEPNGNGTTTLGAGIGIAQHTTKLPIDVTIKGGTINGYSALYEKNTENNSNEDIAKVKVAVEGGTFNTISNGSLAVYSENCTKFITGGTFSADPSAYVATGYEATKTGDVWTVKEETAKEAEVTPAAPTVNIKDNVNEAAANEVKEALTSTSDSATAPSISADEMNAAANVVAQGNDVTVAAATKALEDAEITVNENETVSIVVQPYMDIQITGIETTTAGETTAITELTLDITPMYQTVATTADMTESDAEIITEGEGTNAVVIAAATLPIEETVIVTVPLPASFVTTENVYVKHTKGNINYMYDGTVTAGVLTFVNPHGFSEFTITAAAPKASIGDTNFATLQDALNAANDGETIVIKSADDLTASVTETKSVTLNNATDSEITVTVNGKDITITAGKTATFSNKPSTSTGGGGFSGSYNYPVNAGDVSGAKVSFSDNNAVAGETVTITVTPDSGKQVDEVIVTDAKGNVITVSKVGDNKYSFVMPAGKVNVTVTTEAIDYDTKVVLQINNKNVVVDGRTITNDVAPKIVGDRTLVPIRVIVEALGGTADWNEATRTVTLTIDGKVLKLVIDQPIAGFGQGATIMDSRTYVPVRYVAEYVGANVEWIAETQQIVILK